MPVSGGDSANTLFVPSGHYTVVGPLPSPVTGQSAATAEFIRELKRRGYTVQILNTAVGTSKWPTARQSCKLFRHLWAALRLASGNGNVYLSVHTGAGMWLSSTIALVARARKRPLLLHHHSYEYVRCRSMRAAAFVRASGPKSTHIVLGESMKRDLQLSFPEISSVEVLNNAGLIEPGQPPTPNTHSTIVLGHMSNLTADKGIFRVIDSAVHMLKQGLDVRLEIAGPTEDEASKDALSRASLELGRRFRYWGRVDGDSKDRFFEGLDYFLFPSQFSNEAAPFVILEALSRNVPCISYARGCIPDQIQSTGGLLVAESESFAEAAADWVASMQSAEEPSSSARQRFEEQLEEYESQIRALLGPIRDSPPTRPRPHTNSSKSHRY